MDFCAALQVRDSLDSDAFLSPAAKAACPFASWASWYRTTQRIVIQTSAGDRAETVSVERWISDEALPGGPPMPFGIQLSAGTAGELHDAGAATAVAAIAVKWFPEWRAFRFRTGVRRWALSSSPRGDASASSQDFPTERGS